MKFVKQYLGTVAYLGGVPSVLEEFCWCWSQMVQLNHEYLIQRAGDLIHYDRAKISFHAQARDSLVQRMKGDWMLQLDTDHSFEPDIAIRMLAIMQKYNIGVLSGLYRYKSYPHLPLIFKWDDFSGGFIPVHKWIGDGSIFKIDCAGGGCLMVRRWVFDKILAELGESPFSPIPPLGEDFSFFRKLMLLGIPAFFCPAIECGHMTIRNITSADFPESAFNEWQESIAGQQGKPALK